MTLPKLDGLGASPPFGPGLAQASADPNAVTPSSMARAPDEPGAQPGSGTTPVVLKFGGSSVADEDRLRLVAQRVAERARRQPVVVVVSAMGKTTDRLVATARRLANQVPPRELDMLLSTGERESMALLAIALASLGVDAISLTGSQCGLITDHRFGQARVMEVRPFRILDELAAGRVVIVGGFQGVSYRRDVTTLGRGGSDTSAVALAAAIGADCEIYSDVDGVYSGDPREVDDTRRLEEIDFESMHELARRGAKVLHARAIELASRSGIAIYARATQGGGESVVRVLPSEPQGVVAVARDPNVSLLRITWVAHDSPTGTAEGGDGANTIHASAPIDLPSELCACLSMGLRSLTVEAGSLRAWWSDRQRDDGNAVEGSLRELVAQMSLQRGTPATIEVQRGLELVSCVGAGIEEMPEVIARARTLALPYAPIWFELGGRALSFVVQSGRGVALAAELHGALINRAAVSAPAATRGTSSSPDALAR